MKTKLFLTILAAATLPVAGIAAEASASDHATFQKCADSSQHPVAGAR
jgi:hypothetical protein